MARVPARDGSHGWSVGGQEGSEILQLRNYLGDTMINGRYPRTMQEAFGPYTSDEIYEEESCLWVVVSFAATLAMLVIVI
jgi:hypothetical protein